MPPLIGALLRRPWEAVQRHMLERLDYLERRPDPDDLRSKRVALTPRGTAAVSAIREAVGEMETAWAQQLGPERFAELRSLLSELDRSA